MKKLSNVSPFLLLLFPVFVMMFLAIATVGNENNNQDLASKTSSKSSFVKTVSAVLVK